MNGQGHRMTVVYVCIDPTLGGSSKSLFDMIQSVKEQVCPVVLFPQDGEAFDFFMNHGIECYIHPFVFLHKFKQNRFADVWRRPWRWYPIKKRRIDIGCALYLKLKLMGRRVDIVHSNTSPNDVGVYLARFFRAKHVWHVRECLDDHAQFQMYGGRERLIRKINNADARIAISSYVRNHWEMVERNTYLIHDAICSKDDSVCLFPKEKYVIFVSYNLTEAKGSRVAIKAFGLSKLVNEGYRMVLMGNCKADYQTSLMATAEEFQCGSGIVFLPCQSNVKPFFEKASAMIMASKYEGLGRVTVEAMFYGCPVIAHASGGTLDVVQDRKTGYLFNDIEDCARLLRHVCLTNQEEVALHAQEYAVDNFSMDTYGARILNVYHSLLK